MPFCENCGNKVSETSKFCMKCGSQLETKEAKTIISSDSLNESVIAVETDLLSDDNTKDKDSDSEKVNSIKKRKPFYNSIWFWLLLLVSYYMIDTGNTVLLIPVIITAGIYFFYHGIIKKNSWWGK